MLRKPTWRRQRHPKETPPVVQVANAETEQVRQRFSVRKKFAHTRLGKSLTRFDKRRGSLGKSAKPTKKSSVPDNECHSAVEVDDFSSSSNRDPVL